MKSFRRIISFTLAFILVFTGLPNGLFDFSQLQNVYGYEGIPPVELNYDNFSDTTGLKLNGDALIADNAIQFESVGAAGESVFTTDKIILGEKGSFSTAFSFRNISSTNPTKDTQGGFTFTLQTKGNDVIGSDFEDETVKPSLSIAFATDYFQSGPSARSPQYNGSLIASKSRYFAAYEIPVQCQVSVVPYINGDYENPLASWMMDGYDAQAEASDYYDVWIGYDGEDKALHVLLKNSKGDYQHFISSLELGEILGSEAYIGFMGSMGDAGDRSEIRSLHFKNDTSLVDEAMVEADAAQLIAVGLLNENPDLDNVTGPLYLPNYGLYGSSIQWESDQPDTIAEDGTVNTPSIAKGSQVVTLKATISRGKAIPVTKTFTVTVRVKDEDLAEADLIWLSDALIANENNELSQVVSNLYLPVTGGNGSSISWESSNVTIVNTNGTVTRPTYTEGEQMVVLIATITKGLVVREKVFEITVKALGISDVEMAEADSLWLTQALILKENSALNQVMGDLKLPSLGQYGSSISWASSNTAIVNINGTVTRPAYIEGDQTVTLTATISKGAASRVKTFTLTVKAMERPDEHRVAADSLWLTQTLILKENSASDQIISDLFLPVEGENGSSISWVSSNTSVVNSNGKVTRPSYTEGDQTVTLTATISKGAANAEKTFVIVVKALEQTDEAKVAADYLWLTEAQILNENSALNQIIGDLSLPTLGQNGSRISWTSNYPLIVDTTGVVTRPTYVQGDREVFLRATISKGAANMDKTFVVVVKALEQPDEAKVEADHLWLTRYLILKDNSGWNQVIGDLYLPNLGQNGSSISWTSSNPDFVNSTGKVTRPTYAQGNQTVILTATISKGSAQMLKEFTVEVKALEQTDEEVVLDALVWLSELMVNANGDLSQVTKDLTLPSYPYNGATITWSSSNTSIIGIDGKVTRPAYTKGDQEVTLTVTIRKGSALQQKSYDILVKRLPISTQEIVDEDYKWLMGYNVLGLNSSRYSVTQDLSHPTKGPNGAFISWVSNQPAVISSKGEVMRPENGAGHKSVTITATVNLAGVEKSSVFTYTVLEKPDVLAPIVISATPENNSTGVLWDTDKITLTYSEDIFKGSVADASKTLGIELQAVKTNRIAVTIDKNKLIIEPYEDFSSGENRLLIPYGALTDATGNPTETFMLKFTVEEKSIRKIAVISSVPANLAKDVASNITELTFRFNASDVIAGESFNDISLRAKDGDLISTTSSLSGEKVTMRLNESLTEGTVYEIVIPAGAVQDRFLNYSLAEVLQFRIKPVVIIPRIVSVYPADGQTYVDANQPLEVVFSQEVRPEDCQLKLWNAETTVKAKNPNTLIMTPRLLEPNTEYVLTGPYYSDMNPSQPEFSMKFTTGPWTNLQVVKTSPAAGEKRVPINGVVAIHFYSNVVRDENFEDIKLFDSDGYPVACTITREYYKVYLTPVTELAPSKTYTVDIPRGAYTANNGRITNNHYRFSFTTADRLNLDPGLLEIPSYWFVGKDIPLHAKYLDDEVRRLGSWVYSYEWDFGDGTYGTGKTPIHAYQQEGDYRITVRMKDGRGITYEFREDVNIEALNQVSMSAKITSGSYVLNMPKDSIQQPSWVFHVDLRQNGQFVPGENIGVGLYKNGVLEQTYPSISARTGATTYIFVFNPPRFADGIYELVFTHAGAQETQEVRQIINIVNKASSSNFKFRLYDVSSNNPYKYFEAASYLNVIVDGKKYKALKEWQENLGYYVYMLMSPIASYSEHSFQIEGWTNSKNTVYVGGSEAKPTTISGKLASANFHRTIFSSNIKEPNANMFYEKSYGGKLTIQFEGDWNGLEQGYYEVKTDTGRIIASIKNDKWVMYPGMYLKAGEQLLVRMVSKNGIPSPWSYCPELNMLPTPSFMGERLAVYVADGEYKIAWPTVFDSVIGGSISHLDGVPALGGGNFGMADDMPEFEGDLDMGGERPTMYLTIGLNGGYNPEKKNTKDTKLKKVKRVTAVGYNFDIEVEGGLTFEYYSDSGEWKLKRLVIDMDGYLGKYWSTGYVVGGVIGVTGKAELGLKAGGTLKVDKSSSSTKYSGIIRFGPILDITLSGSYGVGDITGSITAEVPAEIHIPTGYIGADVNVDTKVTAKFLTYSTTLYEKELVDLHWDNGKKKIAIMEFQEPREVVYTEYSGLQQISRDYLSYPSYWIAGGTTIESLKKSEAVALMGGLSLLDTAGKEANPKTAEMLEGIYPNADIQLIRQGQEQWLVWNDDNSVRDAINRTQLRYAYYKDGMWSELHWMDEDGTADFSPSAAAVTDGILIAWQDIKKVITEEEGLAAMLNGSEISVTGSAYNSESGGPSIISLTNDDKLDHSPKLAADGDKALLIWTKSEGLGISLGSDMEEHLAAANSDRLFFSKWHEGAWSTPVEIAGSLPTVLDSSLTMHGEEGLLLYTLDMDNNGSTHEDREVYARLYDGEAWGEAIALSSNQVMDSSPQAAYLEGKWFITWLQGGKLMYKNGLDGEAMSEEYIGNVQKGYQLTVKSGPKPLAALVCRGSGNDNMQGVSVFFYDFSNKKWSHQLPLAAANQYIGTISAGFEEDGTLNAAFTQAEFITEMVPILVDGVEKFIEKTKISEHMKLELLEYSPIHDLALMEEDGLYLSTEFPHPGTMTKVYATLHNKGDFAENTVLYLYDGDPSKGGKIVAEKAIAQPIPAHSSIEVELDWLVGPEEKDEYDLYAVLQGASAVAEANQDNNSINLKVLTADIAITELTWENPAGDDYLITFTVRNLGSKTLEGGTVQLKQEGDTGILGEIPFEELMPGQEEVLTMMVTTSGLTKDEAGKVNMRMEVMPPEGIRESFTNNNVRSFSVKPAAIKVERINPGHGDKQVKVSSVLSLTFNMKVMEGHCFGKIKLLDEELNDITIDAVTEGDTLNITPKNELAHNTTYTLTIPEDALGGTYGHKLDKAFSLSFTTTSSKPEVISTYPGEGMNDTAVDADIRLKFNQKVLAATKFSDIAIYGPGDRLISTGASIEGDTLTVAYTGRLRVDTAYTVKIPEDAVQNERGELFQEDYVLVFVTESTDNGEVEEPGKDEEEVKDTNVSTTEPIQVGVSIGGSQHKVIVQTDKNTAEINLGSLGTEIFSGNESVAVSVPAISNINTYRLELSADALAGVYGTASLTLNTSVGSITIPSGMLSNMADMKGKTAAITIAAVDKAKLPTEVRMAIGDRPVIQLTLSLDGRQIPWENAAAPVRISIPYVPRPEVLEDIESIVALYIDESQGIRILPRGTYNPSVGALIFTTTHFSYYGVGYRKVSFKDVSKDAWYQNAVSFIAARDITTGTGEGRFSPDMKLTRGQFIVMLMKAYGFEPDQNPTENFKDAGNTYYTGYIAAAKRLGISKGVGSNLFMPEKEISRQELFTMLYNALSTIGHLPERTSRKTLTDFTDSGQIADWAKEAMGSLVESGSIVGSKGMLNPSAKTTRAEMAQVLYNLLSKNQ